MCAYTDPSPTKKKKNAYTFTSIQVTDLRKQRGTRVHTHFNFKHECIHSRFFYTPAHAYTQMQTPRRTHSHKDANFTRTALKS